MSVKIEAGSDAEVGAGERWSGAASGWSEAGDGDSFKIELGQEQIQYTQARGAVERVSYTPDFKVEIEKCTQRGYQQCADADENAGGQGNQAGDGQMTSDVQQVEAPRVHQCRYCNWQFLCLDSFKKHMDSHEIYKCIYCNLVLSDDIGLKQHLKTHYKDRYGCVHCPMKFKSQIDLVGHLDRHKLGDEVPNVEPHEELDPDPILKSILSNSLSDAVPNYSRSAEPKSTLNGNVNSEEPKTADPANSILKSYLESAFSPATLQNIKTESDPNDFEVVNDDDDLKHSEPTIVHERVREQEKTHKEKSHVITKEPKVKGSFQCEKCPRKFQFLKKLRVHREMHALGLATFKCRICSKQFQREKALEKHFVKHGQPKVKRDKIYPCEFCPRMFELERCMKRHRNAIHASEIKQYECAHCEKRFTEKNTLDTHTKYFHLKQPDDIELLDGFANRSDYFKCQQCDRYFANSDDFRSHVDSCDASVMDVPKKHYACNLCGRIFDDRNVLEDHKQTHSISNTEDEYDKTKLVDGTYKCPSCSKIFKWKNTYKRHVLEYHPTPVTFSCMRCKVALSSLTELTVHLATHINDSHTTTQGGDSQAATNGKNDETVSQPDYDHSHLEC